MESASSRLQSCDTEAGCKLCSATLHVRGKLHCFQDKQRKFPNYTPMSHCHKHLVARSVEIAYPRYPSLTSDSKPDFRTAPFVLPLLLKTHSPRSLFAETPAIAILPRSFRAYFYWARTAGETSKSERWVSEDTHHLWYLVLSNELASQTSAI